MIGIGMAGSLLFIQVDTPARLVVGPERTITHLVTAGKDLPRGIVGKCEFLDTEIRTTEVQCQVGSLSYRRGVARAMPGGANPEELTERRQLPGRGETANHRKVDPDKIDQSLADQGNVFLQVGVKFSHRDRDRALLANQSEMIVLLRWQGILEEEQAERFQLLCQLHGQRRGTRSWMS